MPVEIERKFIVTDEIWKNDIKNSPELIHQGYLMDSEETTIRVRYTETKGTITIKGKQKGITRDEFEYEVPLGEAMEIFQNHCHKTLVKRRYKLFNKGFLWEVDEYIGRHNGLIIAEIELKNENDSIDPLPIWVGEEVTNDIKFSNAFLAGIV